MDAWSPATTGAARGLAVWLVLLGWGVEVWIFTPIRDWLFVIDCRRRKRSMKRAAQEKR